MTAVRSCIAAAAAAIALGIGAQSARADDIFPFKLVTEKPAAFTAWQELVPPDYRTTPWIYTLRATSTPIVPATIGGKPAFGGFACKPHDCGDNQLTFLMTEDGSRAVARVILAAGEPFFWGHPTAAEQTLLTKLAEPT